MKSLAITVIGVLIFFTGIQVTTTQAAQKEMGSEQGMSDQQGARRGPPPEAYTACEGKSAGATAEMATPRGETLTGTCEAGRDGKLVLRPERSGNNSNGKRRGPPPEAYTACDGKNSGDRSQLTTPRGEVLTGSCEEDQEGKLVLRPDRPKGDRQGGK